MLLVTLLAACAQDWQIAREDRTTGFVNQLDGTPEDDPEPGLTAQDPTSPDVSTRGTRFPFAFLQGPSPFVEGPPELELWIESEVATQAEIVGPASGFGLQVALVPGVNVVPLPTRQLEPVASNFVFDTGLELLTEDPVHVVAVHHRRRFTEATRLLPLEELGVNHRVVAVPDVDEASPSSFVVLATADETRVTIQPAVATTDFRPPFVGYDVELQAGEVVQVQAHGDLTGSLVTADRKVAVFSGGQAPVVDCDGPQHAWEQMPPVSRWATDWLVAPWPDQPYQYAVVVAREPGTVVSLDCTFVAKLGPGESARYASTRPAASAPTSPCSSPSSRWAGPASAMTTPDGATPTCCSRPRRRCRGRGRESTGSSIPPLETPTSAAIAS